MSAAEREALREGLRACEEVNRVGLASTLGSHVVTCTDKRGHGTTLAEAFAALAAPEAG